MSALRSAWALLAIGTLLVSQLPSKAAAQDRVSPVGVESYRFLPRSSIINQSGGFAGVDIDYRVRGTFDFRVMPSPLAVWPPVHTAKFENVEVDGIHPPHEPLDVDAALNLSGISGGERLMNPRTPGLFFFRGFTSDKSAVELQAHLVGPWLYMRGRTTPPAGSADFFDYSIKAVARRLPSGDINADGSVDGGDLIAWRASESTSGDDFLNWQRQVGETAPSLESFDAELDAALAAASLNTAAVPEPSSIVAIASAAGLFIVSRRRRPR